MKYIIIIEETVAKSFEVEASNADDVYKITEQKYKSGEFILDPGDCQFRQIAIMKSGCEHDEWREF